MKRCLVGHGVHSGHLEDHMHRLKNIKIEVYGPCLVSSTILRANASSSQVQSGTEHLRKEIGFESSVGIALLSRVFLSA